MNTREQLRNYLINDLSHCEISDEMKNLTSSLLFLKGKIFNDDSVFTWAEFYYHIALLFESSNEQQMSRVACSSAIELLVLATDIIDDLTDQDEHGEILTKITYPQAMCLSSFLLMESFRIISKYKRSSALKSVIQQLHRAAAGQLNDLSFSISREHIPTEQEYFKHIDRKSVSLTRLVFQMNTPESNTFWNQVATYIGYSGQIGNDARDVFDDTKNDLKDRKATLPIIKAIEASQTKDGGWLLTELTSANLKDDHHKRMAIREYITNTGAIKYCEILAEVYLNKSINLLKKCQETSIHKEAYSNLITFLGDGDH